MNASVAHIAVRSGEEVHGDRCIVQIHLVFIGEIDFEESKGILWTGFLPRDEHPVVQLLEDRMAYLRGGHEAAVASNDLHVVKLDVLRLSDDVVEHLGTKNL